MTPLNSAIGYDEAAKVAKEALKERKTIRQTVIDRGLIGDKLSEEELDKRLDVLEDGQGQGRRLDRRHRCRPSVPLHDAHGPNFVVTIHGR